MRGTGLEIGALHQPSPVPNLCKVEYCDYATKEEIIKFFPELSIRELVDVQYIADLDKDGLVQFEDGKFDFIIANHVIEHVANPIRVLREIFRIIKKGGYAFISAPDKNFTFDKNRALTPFTHLLDEYQKNVSEITDEHYIDFLRAVHPEVFNRSECEIESAISSVKNRRGYVHVWDSSTFKQFIELSLDILKINAVCCFKSTGENNNFEYFSVWQKG